MHARPDPSTPDAKQTPLPALTLRRLGPADSRALRQLAERDSGALPRGEVLGAELDGRLIAALSLQDPAGSLIADPFEHTAAIVAILGERATALSGRESALLERGHRQPGRGKLLPVKLGGLLRT